ncbi:MAG TPA: CinA family protein [Dehalococcoidia bacterium]|nr:CinA family protein [Dehalococcoidia bacterium]
MSGPGLTELSRLAADVVAALKSRGLTIATAEATTGGLIGHLITSAPGSSAVFRGGVAPYSNAMKRAIGVPPETLDQFGAVSMEAAAALAQAIRAFAGADIGLAETGIAGPAGGTTERPAGTFWLAIAAADAIPTERLSLAGERVPNQQACAAAALRMLLRHLPQLTPPPPERKV